MSEGINLALLPPLDVVEKIDLETIITDIAERAALDNASPVDPAYRVALAAAYREMMLRQHANEMCSGVMLAFARGPQLDHIGVTYYRHPNGGPVTRLAHERDDDFRFRLQHSPEGLSVAGPDGAYIFHALSAHKDVKGAAVFGPHSAVNSTAPGYVDMVVLSHLGDGVPSTGLLTAVDAYLWPKRPMTDKFTAKAATVSHYAVVAELVMKQGPDTETVRRVALERAQIYVKEQHKLGGRIVESNLHWALTVEGVVEVRLIDWNDVICQPSEAPFCARLAVSIGGYL
ncbi:baseplate J/gp47 family protein [Shewanella sp. VB17]|uniref:baseplate assembly protein n=1 Tax=Shewanella sp. VB17 TaxID=2739432 RepID=UPI001565D11E|nr:baseplate J/gp47 family protein [Shewanella sp. VB17]NRD72713.1 baseplate J/gp47 family protein [Shewanella sp. VB17]